MTPEFTNVQTRIYVVSSFIDNLRFITLDAEEARKTFEKLTANDKILYSGYVEGILVRRMDKYSITL